MNITIIYTLINLIKMENYVQKIIKGPAKLGMSHWWKVLAYTKFTSLFLYKLAFPIQVLQMKGL